MDYEKYHELRKITKKDAKKAIIDHLLQIHSEVSAVDGQAVFYGDSVVTEGDEYDWTLSDLLSRIA